MVLQLQHAITDPFPFLSFFWASHLFLPKESGAVNTNSCCSYDTEQPPEQEWESGKPQKESLQQILEQKRKEKQHQQAHKQQKVSLVAYNEDNHEDDEEEKQPRPFWAAPP